MGLLSFFRGKGAATSAANLEARSVALDLNSKRLDNAAKKLTLKAMQRAVDEALDPLDALELMATVSGKGKSLPARRHKEMDPLAQIGLQMIQARALEKQPSIAEALREEREFRREIRKMADEADGTRGAPEDTSGDGILGFAERVLKGPLGEAIGELGGLAVSRRIATQAVQQAGTTTIREVPTTPAPLPPPGPDPALPVAVPLAGPVGIVLPPAPDAWTLKLQLKGLKLLGPERSAALILEQANTYPIIAQLLDMLILLEPGEVMPALDELLGDVSDSPLKPWLPLIDYLRQHEDWTAAWHAALRAATVVESESAGPVPIRPAAAASG